MCLTFDYVSVSRAQTVEKAASDAISNFASTQHNEVSCDNLQIGIIRKTSGGVDVISRLPVNSKSATMAMYNVPSDCLGDNDKHLVPCDKVSCVADHLLAWMTPGDQVEIPEDNYSEGAYRSLGGIGEPTFKFPEGKCINDENGTKFLFKSGAFALDDEQIDATGERKEEYLIKMKEAAWHEFKRQLKKNSVRMSNLFECTDKLEDDGTEQIQPEAITLFMELLYPNLIPGHDILVCLPPLKDGKLVMETAFNVRLSYPDLPGKIAIMGAQHNDMSEDGSEQTVEENFYIYSNMSLEAFIPNKETTTGVPIVLHSADPFLPNSRRQRVAYGRTLFPDPGAWIDACEEYQNEIRERLFAQLREDGKSYELAFDGSTLYATNIVGMRIPKSTTHMHANLSKEYASAGNVLERMRKRKQGSAPVAPSATVGGSLEKALAITNLFETLLCGSKVDSHGGVVDEVFDVAMKARTHRGLGARRDTLV